MKGLRLISISIVIFLVSIGLLSCNSEIKQDDNMEKIDKILEQLREVDSSASLYSTSSYYQIVYSNDAGDKINFYNIKTKYYGEIKKIEGIHTEAIRSVIDPILAESSQLLKIQDKEAVIYSYKGKDYLCWTISPEDSCVIEYNPEKFAENDIIMMAENVKSSKEE